MSSEGANVRERALTECLHGKIIEALDRTAHLSELVPKDGVEWRPGSDASRSAPPFALGELLGHLVDSAAGFCAALLAAFPAELTEFSDLRRLCGDSVCSPSEAANKITALSRCIERGFEMCTDSDLGRTVPTIFVPEGERLLTLLLGNFEHLTNHKFQLFFYLKLLGLPVDTRDLYRLRGSSVRKPDN